jgi:hypothetical protein
MKPPRVAHTILKFVIARVGMLTVIVSCCRGVYVTFPSTNTRVSYSEASIEWREGESMAWVKRLVAQMRGNAGDI